MTRVTGQRSPESLGPTIYARPLRFTKQERIWRQSILGAVSAQKRISDKRRKELRSQIDESLSNLRIINHVLKITYHTPNWGNKTQIIDELIYILLTNRSSIDIAGEQFEKLREEYPKWEQILKAHPSALGKLVQGNGLEDDKVRFIRGSLMAIHERFGRIAEKDLQKLPDEQLVDFLKSMPGVGPKTADCVIMYTRQTDVFPADAHCIRTLARLGVFETLGYKWDQAQHKKAQKDLSILMPPGMRSDLHRNLIALGRDVCGDTPRCEDCELKKFCKHYRSATQQQEVRRIAPTIIDVYAGPGGLSAGFKKAGFKIIAAIEADPVAAKTLQLNHPELSSNQVIVSDAREVKAPDLRKLLGDQRLDVLAGGPPCQGFSTIGKRVHSNQKIVTEGRTPYYKFSRDKRNLLYKEIVRLAKSLQPRYVVIENVPGLDTAIYKKKSYVDLIKDSLRGIGYSVQHYVLPVANYGVPQHRQRIFIIAAHSGENLPTADEISAAVLPENERPTLRHAIGDLPRLRADDGQWIATGRNDIDLATAEPQKYLSRFGIRNASKVLWNHVSRFQNGQDLQLFQALRPGEDFASLIRRLGRQPFMRRKTAKNFHDKYYRLDFESYSKTILSHLGKDGNGYVHPAQKRSLSIREAARVQSFPDDYIFCGGMRSQFTQIGNAVPPIVAAAIARVLFKALLQSAAE